MPSTHVSRFRHSVSPSPGHVRRQIPTVHAPRLGQIDAARVLNGQHGAERRLHAAFVADHQGHTNDASFADHDALTTLGVLVGERQAAPARVVVLAALNRRRHHFVGANNAIYRIGEERRR